MSTLAVCGGALGDQILRWPALQRLQREGPLRVLAGRATVELLGGGLDWVARLDDLRWLGLWSGQLGEPTLEPLLTGLRRVVLLSAEPTLTEVLRGLGLEVEDRSAPPPPGVHQACWSLGEPGGDPAALAVPALRPPAGWAEASPPEVLLLPGSGGVHKCWPRERYAQLGAALAREGLRVVAVLGPDELERGWAPLPGVTTWAGTALRPLAAAMAQARLVVGNDAGTTHLAAAVGAPVLAWFGPTDPRRWRPFGRRAQVVRWAADASGGDEALRASLRALAAPAQ